MPQQPQHRVSIVIAGQVLDGWIEYEIGSSMLESADHFSLSRPFNSDAWRMINLDDEVKIQIDDTVIVNGFIDTRKKSSGKDKSSIHIAGRDRVGRLVQESAPTVAYDGLDLVTIIGELASPWFSTVALSDARNRIVRRGKKGRKAAAATEALVIKVKKKTWQVEPGKMRWAIINELASEAGYMVWSSADGLEIVIGQPNYKQDVQYVIAQGVEGSPLQCTAIELEIDESVADRYSLIMALGSGQGDKANFGADVVTRRDVVRNGTNPDGTGLDFSHPKRLIMRERTVANIDEAKQLATREMNRRDFHKQIITATMPAHGQITGGNAATLYAPNTMARVIDQELDLPLDDEFLIYSCSYKSTRDEGETTTLQLVPRGTVFAQ